LAALELGGEIVGIDVKSAPSVTRRDFLGLERVASAGLAPCLGKQRAATL